MLTLSRQDVHELRSSLGAIDMAVEMIAMDADADAMAPLELIKRNVRKMLVTLSQIATQGALV